MPLPQSSLRFNLHPPTAKAACVSGGQLQEGMLNTASPDNAALSDPTIGPQSLGEPLLPYRPLSPPPQTQAGRRNPS